MFWGHHYIPCKLVLGLVITVLEKNIVAEAHCVTRWSESLLARTNGNYTAGKSSLEALSQLLSQANGLHFLENVQSTKGSEPG